MKPTPKRSRANKAAHTELASRGFKSPKKTLAILKKAGVKSVAPLKLPTLAAFKRLSIRARTELLLKWSKTQSGAYDFGDVCRCALFHFGRAITKKTYCAANVDFTLNHACGFEQIEVLHKGCEAVRQTPHTYAALSQRLTAHLAAS